MSAPESERLDIGHIGKAHGLRGEVVVRLTTNRPERLDKGSIVFANGQKLVVKSSRPHQDKWLVHFAEITNRNDSEALRGAQLAAEPIEDADTLWVHELVGCAVVEVDGTHHGVVTEVEDNPASDLLVLDTGGLVPLTFLVEKTDDTLVVDTPPGLLDLADPEDEHEQP